MFRIETTIGYAGTRGPDMITSAAAPRRASSLARVFRVSVTDYYRSAHPGPADVLLLVEVADSSLAYDREIKLPRYARAGIPEVWLMDLAGYRLAIHRQPTENGYAEVVAADELSAIALPLGPDTRRILDLTGLFIG